jgi:hypothetical protein
MKHANLPSLCDKCPQSAHQLAEANPLDAHVLKFCSHTRTLALGFTSGGVIRSWHLEGAGLADAEVEAAGKAMVAMVATDAGAPRAPGVVN